MRRMVAPKYTHTDIDNIPHARYMWVWCKCKQSFVCRDCYHESKLTSQPLCTSCNGKCSQTAELDNDSETDCEEDPIPLNSAKDMRNAFINLVDWGKMSAVMRLQEDVGINADHGLGQLIFRVLDTKKIDPVHFFDILDTLLVEDVSVLHLLNGKPLSDKMKDVLGEFISTALDDSIVGVTIEVWPRPTIADCRTI